MSDTQQLKRSGRPRALSEDQVARVCELSDRGWSLREIAEELHCGHMTVSRALAGHVPTLPLLRGVEAIETAASTQQPSDSGSTQPSEPEREP